MTDERSTVIRPASSGVAIPDRNGNPVRGWKTAFYVVAGVALAGLVAILVLLVPSLYNGYAVALPFGMIGIMGLLVVLIVVLLVVAHYQSAQRNDLADASRVPGIPGSTCVGSWQAVLSHHRRESSFECARSATTAAPAGCSWTPTRTRHRPRADPYSPSTRRR